MYSKDLEPYVTEKHYIMCFRNVQSIFNVFFLNYRLKLVPRYRLKFYPDNDFRNRSQFVITSMHVDILSHV